MKEITLLEFSNKSSHRTIYPFSDSDREKISKVLYTIHFFDFYKSKQKNKLLTYLIYFIKLLNQKSYEFNFHRKTTPYSLSAI